MLAETAPAIEVPAANPVRKARAKKAVAATVEVETPIVVEITAKPAPKAAKAVLVAEDHAEILAPPVKPRAGWWRR